MKLQITSLLFTAIIYTTVAAQDLSKKSEINYSEPFQIDSSEYFMIPKVFDNDDKEVYGKGIGYFAWGNYTNIFFYNSKTNQTQKLFTQLALITSFSSSQYYYDAKTGLSSTTNILPGHIVYLAKTDNFNNDKFLDSNDPVYLFLSDKTGNNLKQVSPAGFHVSSWTVSKDKKIILVKGKNDKNGNKKFGQGDDDLYYRVDLDLDISKIKCYPIPL